MSGRFLARSSMALLACIQVALSAAAAGAAESAAKPDDWTIKFKHGIRFERNDGVHEFRIGGRTYVDFASISLSNQARASSVLPERLDPDRSGAEFRMARIYLEGRVYNDVIFKTEFEFAGVRTTFKDVFIGMKNIPGIGTILIGHQKEPFGLDQLTSSRFRTFMERAAPDLFTPSRNIGIAATNTLFDKRLRWAAGAFSDSRDGLANLGNPGRYNLTARISGAAVYADEGRRVLHLGLSASHKFHGPRAFAQRPESNLAPVLVNTGLLDLTSTDLVGLESALVLGPFSVQAEAMLAWADPSQVRGTSLLWGAYLEASYYLTGESRNYRLVRGAFDRVQPNNNFQLGGRGWGAVQIAVRFSHTDLNDGSIAGGRMQNYSAGVNWELFPNVRLMVNYVHSNLMDDRGHANIFQLRTQLDF